MKKKRFVLNLICLISAVGFLVQSVWAWADKAEEKSVQEFAQKADVITAMKAFGETFGQFRSDNGLESVDDLKASVFSYYEKEFAGEYQKITGKAPHLKKAKSLSDDTIAFQYYYLSNNTNPLGKKHQLDRANDKSKWSEAHAQYHSIFRSYAEEHKLYDLFLVDMKGNIVYSVFKEIDFATNLIGGPYATSGLGNSFDSMKIATKGFVSSENASYFPSCMDYTSFIGTPLYDGEKRIGTLIVQLQSWAEEIVLAFVQKPDVIAAMKAFEGAFGQVRSDNGLDSIDELKKSLFSFYEKDFAMEYKNTTSKAPDLTKAKSLDDDAVALQYYYIFENTAPIGEKNHLVRAKDKSKWTEAHAQYHKQFEEFTLHVNGLYDLFLIDLSGRIVYSVFKEIDFATHLVSGPYASSDLGVLFNGLKEASKGDAKTSENVSYFPSYEDNAQFAGTSIYDGDKKVGILVIQLPSW